MLVILFTINLFFTYFILINATKMIESQKKDTQVSSNLKYPNVLTWSHSKTMT